MTPWPMTPWPMTPWPMAAAFFSSALLRLIFGFIIFGPVIEEGKIPGIAIMLLFSPKALIALPMTPVLLFSGGNDVAVLIDKRDAYLYGIP